MTGSNIGENWHCWMCEDHAKVCFNSGPIGNSNIEDTKKLNWKDFQFEKVYQLLNLIVLVN